jgi:hypothetical protein
MDIQTYLVDIVEFINDSIIPFLLAIAVVAFIWNITRYFIIGGTNQVDREKARKYAMWSLLAFVVIFCIWAIIKLLVGDLGFTGDVNPITPDYIDQRSNEQFCPPGMDPSECLQG